MIAVESMLSKRPASRITAVLFLLLRLRLSNVYCICVKHVVGKLYNCYGFLALVAASLPLVS